MREEDNHEWRIDKNLEEVYRGQFEDKIPTFTWKERRKSQKSCQVRL